MASDRNAEEFYNIGMTYLMMAFQAFQRLRGCSAVGAGPAAGAGAGPAAGAGPVAGAAPAVVSPPPRSRRSASAPGSRPARSVAAGAAPSGHVVVPAMNQWVASVPSGFAAYHTVGIPAGAVGPASNYAAPAASATPPAPAGAADQYPLYPIVVMHDPENLNDKWFTMAPAAGGFHIAHRMEAAEVATNLALKMVDRALAACNEALDAPRAAGASFHLNRAREALKGTPLQPQVMTEALRAVIAAERAGPTSCTDELRNVARAVRDAFMWLHNALAPESRTACLTEAEVSWNGNMEVELKSQLELAFSKGPAKDTQFPPYYSNSYRDALRRGGPRPRRPRDEPGSADAAADGHGSSSPAAGAIGSAVQTQIANIADPKYIEVQSGWDPLKGDGRSTALLDSAAASSSSSWNDYGGATAATLAIAPEVAADAPATDAALAEDLREVKETLLEVLKKLDRIESRLNE